MRNPSPAEIFRTHRSDQYAQLASTTADLLPTDLTGVLIAMHVVRLAAFDGRAVDPWAASAGEFRADLRRLGDEVAAAQARGLVQFTEPLRMADLLPGLLLVARRYPGLPLRLVEVGSAAGLLLAPQTYRIDYPRGSWHPDGAKAHLVSDLDVPPELLRTPVTIEDRLGLDLAPVDPRSVGTFDHLRSFSWAGDPARETRLASALAAVAEAPPPAMAADAMDVLGDVLAERVSRDAVMAVMESGLTAYLSGRDALRLGQVIERAASRGPVLLLTRGTSAPGADDLLNSVRLVDVYRPWRCVYAACDLVSERTRWLADGVGVVDRPA